MIQSHSYWDREEWLKQPDLLFAVNGFIQRLIDQPVKPARVEVSGSSLIFTAFIDY